MSLVRRTTRLGGPWFEELSRGQVFEDAPGLTVTGGHAALHQAIVGDRLRLALDAALCREVTGREGPMVHPNLVCDVSIGQSTGPSQRVRGNLFYRGLVLARPVFVDETLRTRTEIVALKQNRRRPHTPATGFVAMRVRTADEHGEPVLYYWRCPMIPLRDPEVETGHADDLGAIPRALGPKRVSAVPSGWRLDRLRAAVPGPYLEDLAPGQTFLIESGETVTGAPELARLTLNIATAHTDATRARYLLRIPRPRSSPGRRLSSAALMGEPPDHEQRRHTLGCGAEPAGEADGEHVLKRVLAEARASTRARYAALGVLREDRLELRAFLTDGLDAAAAREITHWPRGRGVLGLLIEDARPLRLADVAEHPESYGFPAGHPVIRTFLGVPILIDGEPWGNLYVAEKEDGAEFTGADQEAVAQLARWAARAVARLSD